MIMHLPHRVRRTSFVAMLVGAATCGGSPAAPASKEPGPIFPIPGGLWQPSARPASKKYVVLSGTPGDFIGQGQSYTHTLEDSDIRFTTLQNGFGVVINDGVLGQDWSGYFYPMSGVTRLKPGYYNDLKLVPFFPFGDDSAKARMDWGGHNRGCNSVKGWFVVDHVQYSAALITAIDIRFALHCDGQSAGLRGAVHLAP